MPQLQPLWSAGTFLAVARNGPHYLPLALHCQALQIHLYQGFGRQQSQQYVIA